MHILIFGFYSTEYLLSGWRVFIGKKAEIFYCIFKDFLRLFRTWEFANWVRNKAYLVLCPGFGQDRANFHQNPGRGTALRADPTWPNRARYSIPCAIMLGSGGGELGAGTHSLLGECVVLVRSRRAALWVMRFVLCFLLICIIVVPVPFVCCSVKLPLSRHTSFCLFLSILLCTPAGGGAAAWCFCCRPQPNHNILTSTKSSIFHPDKFAALFLKLPRRIYSLSLM